MSTNLLLHKFQEAPLGKDLDDKYFQYKPFLEDSLT